MFLFAGFAYPTVYPNLTDQFHNNRYILPIFNTLGEVSFLMPSNLSITQILSTPFEENAYIAGLPDRTDCFVVDPGLEPKKIIDYLESRGLTPAAILITHGHSDHIAGNDALKSRWPDCHLAIGADEASKLTDPRLNLSSMFGFRLISPKADDVLQDGETYTVAGINVKTLKIPGHSAGHVVYLIEDCNPMMVFVGDVIFAGSIGRTDLADGDFEQLANGIRTKLYTLPDSTILLPGHGPSTTVGEEKLTNPYVRL
jgi:hydroxyacylglutathione hydrolase